MGSRGGGKIEIPLYYMSFHAGICHSEGGPALMTIYAGDKKVWDGWHVDQNQEVIFRPYMFGGTKKEGGLAGVMSVLPGKEDQVLPVSLTSRFGLIPEAAPGFRGVFSAFFTGPSGMEGDISDTRIYDDNIRGMRGFFQGSNNPYLKHFKFRMRRMSSAAALNNSHDAINLPNRSDGREQKAANPAHVIYELKTSKSFGEGRDPSTIDAASFRAAAATLYNENFGIGFKWLRQSTVDSVTTEIIDHINAALYDDPETGLLTLKLLRDDYDPSTKPLLTPDNCKLNHFKRKLWGEVTGEVTVTWTNPENEQEETVTAHNLTAVQAQGGSPVAASRNFYMIRSSELACKVAARELAAMSHPLAACEATVHRSEYKMVPGEVVRITWPEHGLVEMPMRIMEVGQGSSTSGKVHLKLQEDIFAFKPADYLTPVYSLWEPQDEAADPNGVFHLGTLPAFMTAKVLGYNAVNGLQYPTAAMGVIARKPSSSYTTYDVYGRSTNAAGGEYQESLTTNPYPSYGTLNAWTPRAVTSTIRLDNLIGSPPAEGDFLFIGDGNTFNGEIAIVTAVNGFDYTIMRGCLDTVPEGHLAGTSVYVVKPRFRNISDGEERASGETEGFKFLPSTFVDHVQLEDVSEKNVTLGDRAYLPLRPADCKVNGEGFLRTNYTGGGLNCTWSNRNRKTESEIVQRWDGANVGRETDQYTRIRIVRDNDGAELAVYNKLDGTSYTIPDSEVQSWTTGGTIRVMFGSTIHEGTNTNPTYESFQEYRIVLDGV